MKFTQNISRDIYEQKYRGDDKDSTDTFRRVAKDIALNEKNKKEWEDKFFEIMDSGKLIPAGRIIANAGTKLRYYNNCYVISIEDSMDDIYKSLQDDAMISKVGGGVGFDISKLRPKDAPLSKGGVSSGPISFLEVFNSSAKIIQTAGQRRAAHIALMDITHPDIERFITCKKGDKNKKLTQFNISVKITDSFMRAVENDEDWDLVFDGKVYKTVKARYLYNKLMDNAYIHNEPGVFFVDTVNKYNNGFYDPDLHLEAVNPCGELPLPAYSLCCLSSINLSNFVENSFTEKAEFDYTEFERVVKIGVRFLDNVLDRTEYPLKEIEDNSKKYRRIGLGFTGLADMFAKMMVRYGSEESLKLSRKVARILRNASYRASVDISKEKGCFPGYSKDILESKFIKQLPDDIKDDIVKFGMRNIALNTCAPTGTTSLAFGNNCSSGIEPIFSLNYNRTIRRDDKKITQEVLDEAWREYKLVNKDADEKNPPEFFSTTFDIEPEEQIDIQAIFQKYIDSSISKTLNLPKDYSIEKYKKLFKYAYDKELKGFTTFNTGGSMKGVLEAKVNCDRPAIIHRSEAPKRPLDIPCDIHKTTTAGDDYIILIGLLNGMLYEVFAGKLQGHERLSYHKKGIIRKQKKGIYDLILLDDDGNEMDIEFHITKTFTTKAYNTIARLVSMALRHGTPLEFIVEQLKRDNNVLSFEKSLARVITKYIKDGEIVKSSTVCPSCEGDTFVFESGCSKCQNCGWAACD